MSRSRAVCSRRLKTFFSQLDLQEARLGSEMGLTPPLWSWSRTSGDLANWAEETLLSVVLDLRPREVSGEPGQIREQEVKEGKPVAQLQRVPIGQNRHINTLSLSGNSSNALKKQVLVMAHGYGAGLGSFTRYSCVHRFLCWLLYFFA